LSSIAKIPESPSVDAEAPSLAPEHAELLVALDRMLTVGSYYPPGHEKYREVAAAAHRAVARAAGPQGVVAIEITEPGLTMGLSFAPADGREAKRLHKMLMPLDIALAPIAFMYFMYGRFYFAKLYIASTDCDTCRLCEEKCPTASIRMINKRPFWKFTCESCMRCINICPRQAIQASHSLAVVIAVASSLLPIAIMLKILNAHIPAALQKPVDFIINWGISLTLYFIISGTVFWLIRLKWINKLFSATSLTKYWRRYIAPGIKPRDY